MPFHLNNGRPAGMNYVGLSSPHDQTFAPSPPQQSGIATPIPLTNVGIVAQRGFHKLNALVRKPLAKIVIATQQNRL